MSQDWQSDVIAFCVRCGIPFSRTPSVPLDRPDAPGMMGTAEKRKKMLDEEAGELKVAIDEGDLAHIAKEVGDVLFVALGIANSYGIAMQPVWDLVQTSNMTKDGSKLRPDGKIEKPDGWQPPDIQGEIDRQQTSRHDFYESPKMSQKDHKCDSLFPGRVAGLTAGCTRATMFGNEGHGGAERASVTPTARVPDTWSHELTWRDGKAHRATIDDPPATAPGKQ